MLLIQYNQHDSNFKLNLINDLSHNLIFLIFYTNVEFHLGNLDISIQNRVIGSDASKKYSIN